ncbi:MAG: 50S ribosomal protein L25/general stress protein Ctc [bacterium]|nr:50S ribosomal protein L25/general stress protein Ctc [Gammaproteobacteria bacterium]HIL95463.1 50S ribosomal protein L25/general stress protein Ctc [Pseudomonadales bacterium]
MANEFELNAEVRTDLGKGASRRLRRNAGLVPAILYGAGKDPVTLSIGQNELQKSCENEAFFAHIINLKIAGKKENAIVKALQRHPATERIMHADFLRVKMDQEIHVEVPLHFLNEENCVGVKQDDGMVSHVMSSLSISCLPGDLPEFIEVDVLELNLGSSLHMSDLQLPTGVTIPELGQGEDHDQVVVSVIITRATAEEDEVTDKDEEAAEPGTESEADSEESSED